MKFIAAIDQGTTSTRFHIYSTNFNLIASSHIPLELDYPQNGWAQVDANVIEESVYKCMNSAVKKFNLLGHSTNDIISMGITNQRETTIVWDAITGEALAPAIVWHDTRTHSVVERYRYFKEKLHEISGLPPSTYFSVFKLIWLIENVPSVKVALDEKRLRFGTVDTWLLYKLSGRIAYKTDVTNASRTCLFDIRTLKWSVELLKEFKLESLQLPTVCDSASEFAFIKSNPNCNLSDIPITGILGDQQSALFGHRCFKPGTCKNTYGTGCFLLYNTGTQPYFSQNGLLTTIAYKVNGIIAYALEGSIASAGSTLTWLNNQMQLFSDVTQVDELASNVNSTEGVYLISAFSGLYAPYWRDDVRACILGMSFHTNRFHLIRSALESVCFQTVKVMQLMETESGVELDVLKVDGGMTQSRVCMEIQADLIGKRVERGRVEMTALGVMMCAGVGIGLWGLEELENFELEGRTVFVGRLDSEERKKRVEGWDKAVETCLSYSV